MEQVKISFFARWDIIPSFLVNIVTRWVNFRKNQLYVYELQLSDNNI